LGRLSSRRFPPNGIHALLGYAANAAVAQNEILDFTSAVRRNLGVADTANEFFHFISLSILKS
jgi:hypothetical protein